MIRIELKFDKLLTSLAGNKFGTEVFENQVANVKYGEKYEIVFPERIKYVATSFIQGFFQKFIECFGIVGIEDNIEIVSSIKDFKKFIVDSLV